MAPTNLHHYCECLVRGGHIEGQSKIPQHVLCTQRGYPIAFTDARATQLCEQQAPHHLPR